ncbi:MAG: family 20 glycosylhydrolase [Bryobacterales bacterium]|nr:family 20 glycosylhydrolase [Bryobacterales bacterium]
MKFILILASISAVRGAPLPLMPMAQRVAQSQGELKIDSTFAVATSGYSDFRLDAAIKRFLERLQRQTGQALTQSDRPTLAIECRERASDYPSLGEDESYELDVTTSGAKLQARTVTGILRGLETLSQLIGPGPNGWRVPAVKIEDRPRFAWRGLMIDVARHWMPVSVVERNLAGMAAVKLNVFHWHLSDDQGFRVESKRYPRLHQNGSDGNYYSQSEIRQVVAYARDRGIRVIPEFDIPGHTTAWFAGYPELASAPGPYAIEHKWGVFKPAMAPTREETYTFLDNLIGEMAALFPDPYFHIGGDEVEGSQWKNSASIQAFARAHRLAGQGQLHAYFNSRVSKLLKKHGKIMIGWDEVLTDGLSPDTVIQSWRGSPSLAEAAAKGYRSILSSGYYLDHLQPAGLHYAIDPLDGKAGALPPEQAGRILGGEACMWAEYVSAENVDTRVWPRMAAIAERFWSPREVRDTDSMYERLDLVSRWLEWSGLEHRSASRRMLGRIAGGANPEPFRILADASEALGIEGRRHAQQYTSLTPLNRFVDAVPPESEFARHLASDVARLPDAVAEAELRSAFSQWSALEIRIQPGAESSSFAKELLPRARDLSMVGSIGLRALDFLVKRQPASADWLREANLELDRIEKPVGEVNLAGVRPVRLLLARIGPQSVANTSVRCGNEPGCNSTTTVLNWKFQRDGFKITQ